MALISGSLPPQTCYGTPQQLLDLFAQYLSTPTQNVVLDYTTDSLAFSTAATGTKQEHIFSIAGASIGDPVLIGLPSGIPTGVVFDGYVSAPNLVTLRANFYAAVTTFSASFKVKVFKAV